MIGYYNVSVILTYLGLTSAIIGMFQSFEGHFKIAVLCLMLSGVCDMFDGTIARRCKRNDDEKSFGIQIDSLCDLICFGAFPAVIIFNFCKFHGADSFNFWLTTFCLAAYVLAAVIRLGYFNVSELNRTAKETGKREFYEGLPVTSISLILPFFLVLDLFITKNFLVRFYNIGLLIIGLLFVSRIKIKKPYFKGLFLVALIGAILFTLILIFGGQFNA